MANPLNQIKKVFGVDQEEDEGEDTKKGNTMKKRPQEDDSEDTRQDEDEEEEEDERQAPKRPPVEQQPAVGVKQVLELASKLPKTPVHDWTHLAFKDGSLLLIPHAITNEPVGCLQLDANAQQRIRKILDSLEE